jgi:hypothetical protein
MLRNRNLFVNGTAFHQIGMGAFTDHPAFIEHYDLLGVLDG